MPKKKAQIDKSEWTLERITKELLGDNNQLQPFTEESKAALYGLSRQEALQLDPRLFQRWRMHHEHYEMAAKGAKTSNRKKKELKDWSIKVRKLLNNPDLTATMINQKRLPKWFNGLEYEEGDMPTPAEVIAATLMAKAMQGDVRAIEELRKMGFGDKITLDTADSFFNKASLQLEIVNPNEKTKEMEAKEFGHSQEESSLPKQIPEQKTEDAPEVIQNRPQDGLTVEVPKPLPQAEDIPGENIPQALQDEFNRQEEERLQPQPTVDSHGIDRSILDKITITKNKPRQ